MSDLTPTREEEYRAIYIWRDMVALWRDGGPGPQHQIRIPRPRVIIPSWAERPATQDFGPLMDYVVVNITPELLEEVQLLGQLG
jgi:hypothetical protein